MSFGSGESSSSSSTATSFNSYLQTGAAQGITAVVSSGDVGAAGGDTNEAAAPATQVLEINVICASGYVTCVGGTEFSETTANASTYWASTNSSTKSSALSYIPEGGWNDIAMTSGKYYPSASGGGASQFIAKPSWQVGTGVPADGMRDSPDVAFTASGAHDGYVLCITDTSSQGGCVSTFYTTGGTSASAPSMAGIIAILNQRMGSAEGNINPLLYSLASTSPSVFHDTTVASSGVSGCVVTTPSMCNNSTPATTTLTGGLSGYLVGTGYDQVTGLGSIDVNNLLTAAAAAPRFTLSPTSLSFLSGATTGNSSVVTLTSLNGFAGPISAIGCTIAVTSGGYYPATCAMSATTGTLTAGGTTTSTLTITSTTAHAMLETPSSLIGRGTVLAGGTLFAALLLLPGLRRRRIVRSLAAAGLLFCGIAGLNGCGGSSTAAASAPTTHSSAGTYVVTITATGTNTGSTASTTATTTVGVTIN